MQKMLKILDYYKKLKEDKLKFNLIQFVIGLILILIVSFYLIGNKAERVSLLGGPQILYQNIKLFIIKSFTKDGEYYDDKIKLQKSLKEIINVAEYGNCMNSKDIIKLKNMYQELDDMNIETYKQNVYKYYIDIGSYYKKVQLECK